MNPELPSSSQPQPPPPTPPAPPAGPRLPGGGARTHRELLEAIRSAQRRELWVQGFSLGFAAAAVALMLAGFVGTQAPTLGRLLAWAAPVLLLAAVVFFAGVRLRRTVGDDARTARLLRDRIPALGGDVLSAVELRAALSDAGVSRTLVEAFISLTDDRVSRVDVHQVVDRKRTQRLGLASVAVVAGCLMLVAASQQRWSRGFAAAFAERGKGEAEVVAEPITGDVELTYHYPAHTGYAPRTVTGTNGDISAPAGTRVQLKTRADRKVGKAELLLDGATVALKVDGERDLSGELVVQRSGSYQFRFLTSRGRELAVGPKLPINVEADTAPKVTVLTPGDEVEVDPDQKLTLKYDVNDDFGIIQLELVWRVSGRKDEQRVPLPKDEGRASRGTYTWDLSGLKLRPGDRVSYFVEAKDNDAVSGPKRGVSRTLSLKTYSAAEHRREALQRAEQLWERMITQLADRMEGTDRDRDHTLDQVKAETQVDERGQQLAADLTLAAAELARSKDAPAELWAALENIGTSLGQRTRQTASTRRLALRFAKTKPSDVDLGRRLIRVVEQEISELEKDVLYLEALLDRHKIQDLKELAKELANDRRELAQLVEQYKQTQDPAAREQILQQVTEMRQRINELMQRMAELAKGIRDEHFNAEAMAELMQEDNMAAAMDEIDKLLREGKVDEALKKLQELSMQMEEMIQSMDEADQELGQQVDPELAAQFGKFMEDLEKTTKDQQELADQTKELRDRYRQKVKDRLAQKGKQLKDELLKDVEKLQKDYQQVDPNELGTRGDRSLEATQKELENLKSSLQIEDYDLAAEAAARAEQHAVEVSREAEQRVMMDEVFQNPPEARAESQRTAERLKKDEQALHEMSRKLQQLFPNPSQVMSEADQKKMKQQAQDQKALKQRADQLRQQMEQIGEKAPVFDQAAEQQMQGAADRMGDASQKLEGKDVSRGHGDQRAALEQLQQFQQRLQQNGKGKGGKKGGLPLPMMGMRQRGPSENEKVEIPDEDQFQAPKEFRKDLLDAMKQGAPDRYKDQVKRYYEELVK